MKFYRVSCPTCCSLSRSVDIEISHTCGRTRVFPTHNTTSSEQQIHLYNSIKWCFPSSALINCLSILNWHKWLQLPNWNVTQSLRWKYTTKGPDKVYAWTVFPILIGMRNVKLHLDWYKFQSVTGQERDLWGNARLGVSQKTTIWLGMVLD